MNSFTALWLLWSDTNGFFFFKGAVCHLSGDGRGERWVPHSFFFYLLRTSSKEAHWNQDELKVRKIMRIFTSSICAIYIGAASPIFTVLQQNQQDMSTIPQGTCALHFVCLCAPFLLLGCFQVGIIKINYANLFIFEGVSQGKIGFREIKASKMIFFGSLIYYYLVCVDLYFAPLLWGHYKFSLAFVSIFWDFDVLL